MLACCLICSGASADEIKDPNRLWVRLAAWPHMKLDETLEMLERIQRNYTVESENLSNGSASDEEEEEDRLSSVNNLAKRQQEVHDLLEVMKQWDGDCESNLIKLLRLVQMNEEESIEMQPRVEYIHFRFRRQLNRCESYVNKRVKKAEESLVREYGFVSWKLFLSPKNTTKSSNDVEKTIAKELTNYLLPRLVKKSGESHGLYDSVDVANEDLFRPSYEKKVVDMCETIVDRLEFMMDIYAVIKDDVEPAFKLDENARGVLEKGRKCKIINDDMSSNRLRVFERTYRNLKRKARRPLLRMLRRLLGMEKRAD